MSSHNGTYGGWTIAGNLEESFLEIQKLVREKFWKCLNQHNYKQIIYHEDEGKIHAIMNEKDWESFKQKDKIHVAFIPKHFTSIDAAIKKPVLFHDKKACGFCAIQPIIGTLYKCLQCPDFHLCEVCEADQHHSHHMMFAEKFLISANLSANLSAGIHCESCGVKPITGIRHKCISCKDGDFCESCIKLKLLPCKDHEMIRFPFKRGAAAAGTVVSQTKVQLVEDNQLKIINNKLNKLMELITSGGLNISDAAVVPSVSDARMETSVVNIDGDSAGKSNEKNLQQEEKADESNDVNRNVYKAD